MRVVRGEQPSQASEHKGKRERERGKGIPPRSWLPSIIGSQSCKQGEPLLNNKARRTLWFGTRKEQGNRVHLESNVDILTVW